jgi:hypothetical protein
MLAALIVAVPTVTGAASARSRTTSLHVYLAFRADRHMASSLKVVTRSRGECSSASHVSTRVDAWRCGPAQGFYDPCFANGGRATGPVICPQAPWSNRVVLMRLSKPLPVASNPTGDPLRSGPWGIVTATGKHCRVIATGTINVAGMRVSYLCVGGGYLVGEERRATQPWKIFYLRNMHANRLTEVSIASAWW